MNILHKAANAVKDERKHHHRDEKKEKEKRKSIVQGSAKPSPRLEPVREKKKPAYVLIEMESPPLVMYGSTTQSTGALMSGQFVFQVNGPDVRLETMELELVIEQTNKKPVEKGCPDCMTKTKLLRRWRFLSEPTTFSEGKHQFPFSFLLEGHLPASTETPLGSIAYVLYGHATPTKPFQGYATHTKPFPGPSTPGNTTPPGRNTSISAGATDGKRPSTPSYLTHSLPDLQSYSKDDFSIRHNLPVYRALQPPEADRNAIRIFPPTNLQAMCTIPHIMYPMSTGFPVLLRLQGVAEHADMAKTVRNWKLKKLTWRLEETTSTIAAACDKHASKVGGKGKGITHSETHTLGGKELREGWKADYTPPALDDKTGSGSIEIELVCGPKPRTQHDPRPACDVETQTGFTVQHKLVIECVVTEELHQIDKPKWVAPTGMARILRMGFEIKVSERMGLGISWDEEQPPVYEDVPASPPGYEGRGDGPQLGDRVSGPLAVDIPGAAARRAAQHAQEPYEEPPSYAANRMGVADDEDWEVHHVDLSEGIRPIDGAGSSSRNVSTNVGEGPSSSVLVNSPAIRATNARGLDMSDLETDPYEEMRRGRRLDDDEEFRRVGSRDE